MVSPCGLQAQVKTSDWWPCSIVTLEDGRSKGPAEPIPEWSISIASPAWSNSYYSKLQDKSSLWQGSKLHQAADHIFSVLYTFSGEELKTEFLTWHIEPSVPYYKERWALISPHWCKLSSKVLDYYNEHTQSWKHRCGFGTMELNIVDKVTWIAQYKHRLRNIKTEGLSVTWTFTFWSLLSCPPLPVASRDHILGAGRLHLGLWWAVLQAAVAVVNDSVH